MNSFLQYVRISANATASRKRKFLLFVRSRKTKNFLRYVRISTTSRKRKVLLFVCGLAAIITSLYSILYYFLKIEPCDNYNPQNTISFQVSKSLSGTSISFMKTDNPFKDRPEWRVFQENLARYKAFHKKKLSEIKSSKDGGSVRTLTWSCSQVRCGGMGDQLFRIQYFLLLAMMSDRLFLVHWDEKMRQSSKYFLPGEIDWTYYDEQKGICGLGGNCDVHKIYDCTSNWGFGWTKSEYIQFSQVLFGTTQHVAVTGQVLVFNMYIGNRSIVDTGPLITQGMKKLGALQIFTNNENDTVYCKYEPLWYNWMLRFGIHKLSEIPEVNSGHIQASESWLYFSHYTFSYLFRFPEDLVKIAEDYQKQLGLHGKDYLSLHLRTGFMGTPEQERYITRYINSGWKFFYHKWEWHCFIEHAIKIRNEVLGQDKYIYVSTDSDIVRVMVDTQYAGQKIVYGNFGLVHSANQKSCGEYKGVPIMEGYLATWVDFYLMGRAKFMVHSYSSFAVNAAFLKPVPHKFHAWMLWNEEMGCLASHTPGKSTCIC